MSEQDLTNDQRAELVQLIQSDPGFREEMAAVAAEAERAEQGKASVFAGWVFCGKEISPPGPTVWRWLDIARSPLAPGGDFESISDGDIVLALRIICEGRQAIRPYLSLPARLRRASAEQAVEIEDQVTVEAIEAAYEWADQFDAGLQEIADLVVEILQASAPVSIKKN